MRPRRWHFLVLLLGIGIYVLWKAEKEQNSLTELQSSNLQLLVQKAENTEGWMYSIFDGKVLIVRQEVLPVLMGNHKIPSKEVAEQLGLIVMEKIKNKKIPAITQEELDRIIPPDLRKDCIH